MSVLYIILELCTNGDVGLRNPLAYALSLLREGCMCLSILSDTIPLGRKVHTTTPEVGFPTHLDAGIYNLWGSQ
jgi:hypothetical protein